MSETKHFCEAILLTGSNLDNRYILLDKTLHLLSESVEIVAASNIYESEPWGFKSNNTFLNQAIHVKTQLSPEELLKVCLQVETKLGRVRNSSKQYQDRTIDVDIILYENEVINSNVLQIPHPRMTQRRFCMAPVAEIVPDWLHPQSMIAMKDLLELCIDTAFVKEMEHAL